MSIEIVGKFLPRPRVITGWYSFDHAFVNEANELGFPVGHGTEIFGANYIGKTTFALSLGGVIASNLKENISLIDLEGFDPIHLIKILTTIGYDGKVLISNEEEDEDQLDEMIINLRANNCCVGILDSIGAISPISEAEGKIGEANMGRRAFALAQFARKGMKLFKHSKTPKSILMINHWYPIIGGRGYQTPGGKVKDYLASVRILLKKKEEFPDKSYVLEGTVRKNRWGYPDKVFYVFVLSGRGVHTGLSNMYDCLITGKAQRGKGAGISVKIGEEKTTIAKLVKEAKLGNNEPFEVFRLALSSPEEEIKNDAVSEIDYSDAHFHNAQEDFYNTLEDTTEIE